MLKSEIRTLFKLKRSETSELVLNEKSNLISKKVINYFDFKGKKISIFLPIAKFKEVNTYLLIEELKKIASTLIAIPKSNFNDFSIKHYLLSEDVVIIENSLGIPEPTNYLKEVKNNEFDIVFVPLISFNAEGYRVGYGKGFYDRFLRECSESCLFIGLSIFDDPNEIDDVNEFDIPLHYCFTPNRIFNFKDRETSR